jgi:hypothetical protein
MKKIGMVLVFGSELLLNFLHPKLMDLPSSHISLLD